MAQVVVDSSVMRDKAKTLENAAVTIQSLYAEMLQEVTTTANKMKGTPPSKLKKSSLQICRILLILLSRTLRHTAHSSPRLLKVMKLLSVKALRKLRSRAKSSDFLEA